MVHHDLIGLWSSIAQLAFSGMLLTIQEQTLAFGRANTWIWEFGIRLIRIFLCIAGKGKSSNCRQSSLPFLHAPKLKQQSQPMLIMTMAEIVDENDTTIKDDISVSHTAVTMRRSNVTRRFTVSGRIQIVKRFPTCHCRQPWQQPCQTFESRNSPITIDKVVTRLKPLVILISQPTGSSCSSRY